MKNPVPNRDITAPLFVIRERLKFQSYRNSFEMERQEIVNWLLQGDVSLQYQTHLDLLSIDRADLRKKIETSGWGWSILSRRMPNGHWGKGFYQPKWTSSHYTLLDLKILSIDPGHPLIRESVDVIARYEKGKDGGINPAGSVNNSDVCINGMFMNYAAYFNVSENDLKSVVDFVLGQIMPDGGFNCRSNRSKAVHSSFHTTLSVLEGITEYELNGYTYRLNELQEARKSSLEFILKHKLFLSDRTGEIIHKDFLKLSYPCRWRYDVLKALDYFQYSKTSWDKRMQPAIQFLISKRNKDGTWNVQAHHPGQVHIHMEKAGKPSRWNTLRAMRVLKYFGTDI